MSGEEFINKYKDYFSYEKDFQMFLKDVHLLCDKCYLDGMSNAHYIDDLIENKEHDTTGWI